MEYAVLVGRFILSSVFLFSGLAKIGGRAEFESAVTNYRILPTNVSTIVAYALPPVEVLGAVALVLGVGTRIVAIGVTVLLAAFTFALVLNLVRGREMDCGCFGEVSPRQLDWTSVARNVVLVVLSVMVPVATTADFSLAPFWRSGAAGHVEDPLALLVGVTTVMLGLRVAIEGRRFVESAHRAEINIGGSR